MDRGPAGEIQKTESWYDSLFASSSMLWIEADEHRTVMVPTASVIASVVYAYARLAKRMALVAGQIKFIETGPWRSNRGPKDRINPLSPLLNKSYKKDDSIGGICLMPQVISGAIAFSPLCHIGLNDLVF